MSAIAEKNLGNGRKFARIFKVYNRLIYTKHTFLGLF